MIPLELRTPNVHTLVLIALVTWLLALALSAPAEAGNRYADCGGEGERAIFERPVVCQSGLVQQLHAGTSCCRRLGADGYPPFCGGDGQPVPELDLDGSGGIVNAHDLALFRLLFGKPPGESAPAY